MLTIYAPTAAPADAPFVGLPPDVAAARISAGKGGQNDEEFGDFNEEDFDDDFDDDFEEEMDDEYELSEIEGEVEVPELDDDDLDDLPLDEKIVVKDDDEDGFDEAEPAVAADEEELEEEAE